MVYILYNPLSSEGTARKYVNEALTKFNGEKIETQSVLKIKEYKEFFSSIDKEDKVVLLGGDGTINVLINQMQGEKINNELFIYKAGTGNDFLRDIFDKMPEDGTLVKLNEYLEKLPVVTVNDKEYFFLNGVGYGLDGKCCTIAEEQRAKGKTDINYTSIAIKLLMFTYKPTDATVIVDGEEYKYKNVWISPIMNGRYYGGGMKITPDQDRKGDVLSTCIFHGSNKLKTLINFPKIFEGKHVGCKDIIDIYSGHEITIRLDSPQDVQIDGELIRDVKEITGRKYSDM